jgi:DNA-binding transcriptional ArsR family regulator
MLDQVVKAIAEPRRREILALIREEELTAGEIASHFEVTRPAISQHLGVLLEAGLVTCRKQGTQRFYRARPEGTRELLKFLDTFWESRLLRLKEAAENHLPKGGSSGKADSD